MGISEEESDYICRVVDGDEDALEDLLQLHQEALLQFIQRQIPRDLARIVDAVDVLQETSIEAFRQIGNFRPSGENAVFRWLATIARNNLIDLVRKHRAKKRVGGVMISVEDSSVISMLEQLAVYSRTPSQSAARHEFMAAVQRALLNLPEPYRQVLTLRHIEGRDVKTTAEIMNRTGRAVEHLTSRALIQLKEELGSQSLFSSRVTPQ